MKQWMIGVGLMAIAMGMAEAAPGNSAGGGNSGNHSGSGGGGNAGNGQGGGDGGHGGQGGNSGGNHGGGGGNGGGNGGNSGNGGNGNGGGGHSGGSVSASGSEAGSASTSGGTLIITGGQGVSKGDRDKLIDAIKVCEMTRPGLALGDHTVNGAWSFRTYDDTVWPYVQRCMLQHGYPAYGVDYSR